MAITIDHMGLLAGMCKELGIANLLDSLVPNQSETRNISFGETVVSMMLNGLGFNARTLHMFPEFCADKPLDKLIRSGIQLEHINKSVLGRVLDPLYELGVSEVYLSLAVKAINVLKLPCKVLNLDSTRFHVNDRYNSESEVAEEDMSYIKLCLEALLLWNVKAQQFPMITRQYLLQSHKCTHNIQRQRKPQLLLLEKLLLITLKPWLSTDTMKYQAPVSGI